MNRPQYGEFRLYCGRTAVKGRRLFPILMGFIISWGTGGRVTYLLNTMICF